MLDKVVPRRPQNSKGACALNMRPIVFDTRSSFRTFRSGCSRNPPEHRQFPDAPRLAAARGFPRQRDMHYVTFVFLTAPDPGGDVPQLTRGSLRAVPVLHLRASDTTMHVILVFL